jgi:hypothetical protein
MIKKEKTLILLPMHFLGGRLEKLNKPWQCLSISLVNKDISIIIDEKLIRVHSENVSKGSWARPAISTKIFSGFGLRCVLSWLASHAWKSKENENNYLEGVAQNLKLKKVRFKIISRRFHLCNYLYIWSSKGHFEVLNGSEPYS